jgi:hypothetical protein
VLTSGFLSIFRQLGEARFKSRRPFRFCIFNRTLSEGDAIVASKEIISLKNPFFIIPNGCVIINLEIFTYLYIVFPF